MSEYQGAECTPWLSTLQYYQGSQSKPYSHRDRRRAVKELMTLRAKVKEQQRLLGVGAAFKEAASAKVREIQARAKAAVDAQCQAQDELEAAWDANINYRGCVKTITRLEQELPSF